MIGFFRRFLTSPLALGLLGLVLVAFVVTGVRDPFGGGGAKGTLARVGGVDITEVEFGRLWQRAMANLRESNPKVTPEQAARQGAVDQLFDQTISGRALERFALAQGIAAGPKLLDAEIASIPQFQLAGHFDQRSYEAALAGQHLTDREVRDQLRGDILRRQLLAPLGIGATTPEGAALPYARLILEGRQGLIGVIPSAALTGVAAPTPANLSTFYTQHRAQFTIPERRTFRYALIDAAALGSATAVSYADAAVYYKAHSADYAALDKRQLAQAVVPDEATARRLAQAARAGSFDAAAASIAKLTRADTEIGVRSEKEFAAATSAAVAHAAFSVASGGISDPVKSDFGWHVVKVEAIQPGVGRTIEQARPDIVAALQQDHGTAKLADVSDAVQAALGKGGNFTDLAKKYGLTTVTTPPLTATGGNLAGYVLDPALQPLLSAAFQTDAGEPATVEDLKNGRAALFQVGDVTPPTLPKLTDIQAQVAAVWTAEARARQARTAAEQIVAEVRGGATMAAALANRGLKPPQPVAVRRIDLLRPNAQVPPPIAFLFSLPEGTVRALPAGPQGSYVVQEVKVVRGDPTTAPKIVEGIRQQFAGLAANELADQFARAAAQDVGVKRNAAAIARVRARLAGGADTAQP